MTAGTLRSAQWWRGAILLAVTALGGLGALVGGRAALRGSAEAERASAIAFEVAGLRGELASFSSSALAPPAASSPMCSQ